MSTGRIIWAMNPLADEKAYFKHALKVIGEFATASGVEVEPVVVLAPPSLLLPVAVSRELFDPMEPQIQKLWTKLSKGNKYAKLFLEPTILTDDSLSQHGMSKALTNYAVTVGAQAIAVATHGRKGVARFFMGSFAETLVQTSPLPTFVFNPKAEKAGRTKKIFFPVNLPLDPETPVDEILRFALQSKAKIVFFHKIDYINEYTVHPLFQVAMYQGYVEEDINARWKELQGLLDRAKTAGVKADAFLDKGGAYTPDRIVSSAKKHGADLIVMVAKTGRVESAILGSVTRQVIRTAIQPVWVLQMPKQAAVKIISNRSEVVVTPAKTARKV